MIGGTSKNKTRIGTVGLLCEKPRSSIFKGACLLHKLPEWKCTLILQNKTLKFNVEREGTNTLPYCKDLKKRNRLKSHPIFSEACPKNDANRSIFHSEFSVFPIM